MVGSTARRWSRFWCRRLEGGILPPKGHNTKQQEFFWVEKCIVLKKENLQLLGRCTFEKLLTFVPKVAKMKEYYVGVCLYI